MNNKSPHYVVMEDKDYVNKNPEETSSIKHVEYSYEKNLNECELVSLYKSLSWSSAEKPKYLVRALANSHTVITAWADKHLIGLGNAISDGYLVVYYPHLLVHPDYQQMGIGKEIMKRMNAIYRDFHQQLLVADGKAISFYKKCGFKEAGSCEALWIYTGKDHD